MLVYKGNGVSDGIVAGRLEFHHKKSIHIEKRQTKSISEEILRFRDALQIAKRQLQELSVVAEHTAGRESADVFEAHQMMLEDEIYLQSISSIIEGQKADAEYAVQIATKQMAERFKLVENAMLQEKVSDIEDVSRRLLDILTDNETSIPKCEEATILVADEMLPSEMIQIDRKQVVGIVLKGGNAYSHTVIIARNMGIPMIVGMTHIPDESDEVENAVLDGSRGVLYVNPKSQEVQVLLSEHSKEYSIVFTDHSMEIYANINGPEDVDAVLQSRAYGIGLFRTEFIYLQRDTCPTEEQQFQIYREVVQRMHGNKVVIRTADLGADKKPTYLTLGEEENSETEYRGIGISLMWPELFLAQLRAILKASVFGKVAILFPFATSVQEVQQAKRLLNKAKEMLQKEGMAFDEKVEIGIMIETPEVVSCVRELAREGDFVSIGTNDLIRTILSEHRQDTCHQEVMKIIQMVTDGTHAEGKKVCICGEMASDLALTETFAKMGVDALSVAPHMANILKKIR